MRSVLTTILVAAIVATGCQQVGDGKASSVSGQPVATVPTVPRFPAGLADYQIARWTKLSPTCATANSRDIPSCLRSFVEAGHVLGVVTVADGPGIGSRIDAVGNVTPTSIFQIMSMTKPFVAVAIMRLVEQGKIPSVDTPVSELPGLDDFPYKGVTLKQLLTHTSGMWYVREEQPGVMVGIAPHLTNKLDKAPDVTVRDKSLAFVARHYANPKLYPLESTSPQYSNIGYTMLGWILERVSGQPFHRLIQQEVLDPLGMKDTFFFPDSASADQRARIVDLDHRVPHSPVFDDYERLRPGWNYPSPEGGLYSTAHDLRQFLLLFRYRGQVPGQSRVLSPESVRRLVEDEVPGGDYSVVVSVRCKGRIGHTLAFFVVRAGGCPDWPGFSQGTIEHDGRFSTDFWYDPVTDRVGVFLYQAVSDYASTPGIAENDVFKQTLAAIPAATRARPNDR